jgi:hypothetical protein
MSAVISSQPIFDCIQTFFVDPEAVQLAADVMLTSAEVYFKTKPSASLNTSGYTEPGVVASICEVVNGLPDPTKILEGSITRANYSQVYAFSDASVPTVFRFNTPVVLLTGRSYGLVLRFEDTQYTVWTNHLGDKLVGTNTPSAGSGNVNDGQYYVATNTFQFNPLSDVDLKYRINVARFQGNTATIVLVNKDYEFLTLSDRTGTFKGGEWVYKQVANATGTISLSSSNLDVVGTGTTLTSILDGDFIVALGATGAKQVLKVDKVTNTTLMTLSDYPAFTNTAASFKVAAVGQVYYQNALANSLYLVSSSANNTLKFAAGANVVGATSNATANIVSVDTYGVDQFVPKLAVQSSESSIVNFKHDFAYSNGSAYIVNTAYEATTTLNEVNKLDAYNALIVSRSLEVAEANLYDSTERKSAYVKMTVNVATGTSSFSVPRIKTSEVDIFTHIVQVSNTHMNGTVDTEVYKNGTAESKGITKKYSFANNRFAQDLRVYVVGYRPPNTNILVYAKLHNSNDPETFDDKLWSPLTLIQNGDKYSTKGDASDLIEYEYGIQQYPDTDTTVPGFFTTTLSSALITAQGVVANTYITANDLVKVYNPLIKEDFMISPVVASNTTTITLGTEVANNNIVGSGFVVDKLLYKGTAFNNAINGNIVRYFTSTLVEVDKFDSMQFKIVFISDLPSVYPEVDSIQAIGVNAGASL